MTKLFNYLTEKGIRFNFVPAGFVDTEYPNMKKCTLVNFHIYSDLSIDDIKNILDDSCKFKRLYAHREHIIIEFAL